MSDASALLLAPLLLLLVTVFPILGFIAFLRTGELTAALRRAEERIAALEKTLAGEAPVAEAAPAPAVAATLAAAAPGWTEPVAPAPLPSPAPQPTPAPALPFLARIERALASNWFVWLGGGLIALAIVFLLQVAINNGVFTPPAQLGAAYLLGAALIAGGEYLRGRRVLAAEHTQLARLPAILAAAGLFAWFMASLAGNVVLHVISERAAFALMALASLAAILLALRFGRWLAALGLAGGYTAPALIQIADPSAGALFGYLIGLTAAALALIRMRRWPGFVWMASGGALLWGFAWTASALAGARASVEAAAYILALPLLGFAFAWSFARGPLRWESWRTVRAGLSEPVLAAYAVALAAGADLLFLALRHDYEVSAVLAALLGYCALTCAVAYVRERFALLPFGAVAIGAAMLLAWPPAEDAPSFPALASSFLMDCGVLGFTFTAGGWLMMLANRSKTPGAALAALGPLAVVLASHERAAHLRLPLDWAAAGLGLTAINLFGLWQIARTFGGLDKAPGPSAAFALGAAGAAVVTILFGFTAAPLSGAAALALLAPVMALLDRRFALPALRWAVSLTALIVVWRLGPSLEIFFAPLSRAPLLNAVLPVYAIAAAAFYAAARIYRRGGVSAGARVVQALEASALIVAAAGISFEIRHLATGGDLGAAGFGLAELSADVIAWIGLALALAARFGARPRLVLFWGEAVLAALAAGAAILALALFDNPWWGQEIVPINGPPLINLLLAAYGIPAALFAGYAVLRRRQGLRQRANVAGAIAVLLAFLNVTLEIRRLYHPLDMATAPIGQWEAWSYTAAWIGFAAALLGLGLIREKPSLRYASLVVLLAAIIKAFGFDIHALSGVLLAAQLLGLGLSVIAVTLIYQRFVAPRVGAETDPDLAPPN